MRRIELRQKAPVIQLGDEILLLKHISTHTSADRRTNLPVVLRCHTGVDKVAGLDQSQTIRSQNEMYQRRASLFIKWVSTIETGVIEVIRYGP